MTDIIKENIKELNDLIETSKDGEAGFKDLAEHTKHEPLRSVFLKRASETGAAASELQALVVTLGGKPETSTSVSGDLHRRWIDLKAAITGKDDAALLNEAERGEDVAKKSYSKALENQHLTPDVRAVIQKQYDGVLRNHDQIKALRDQARAAK
ncbi:PA2169 family four-helix-bundle protein [Pseudomonas sp. NPDC007930]|uniref:PA2169 family four-helix-bundle protein n=1 Tax=Pseudomonas sp. NPDC007930 TaxID=3364417 RepID=UPI0036ECCCA7